MLTDATSVVGGVPERGDTWSQVLELLGVTVTEKLFPAALDVMLSCWEAGGEKPACPVNDSEVGLLVSREVAVRVRVTETVTAVPVDGVSVMVPEYVPADRPEVCTETVTVDGVIFPACEACSQFPPLLVAAEAVNEVPEGLDVIVSCWDPTEPPD